MPFLIQRYPGGLLGLLGSQSSGVTPASMADLVTPTVDLTQFYYAEASKSIQVTVAVAAVGPNNFAGPGSNSLWANETKWAVHYFGAFRAAALGAGQSIKLSQGWNDSAGNTYLTDGPQSWTVPEVIGQGLRFDPPLILTRGELLTLHVHSLAAGPVNVLCSAHYTPLEFSGA